MVAPGGIAIVGVGLGGGSGAEGVSRIGIDLFARAITCVIVEVGVRLAEVGVILAGELVP